MSWTLNNRVKTHINNKKEYRTITNFSQWEVNEDNVRHIETKEVRPLVLNRGLLPKVSIKRDDGQWRMINLQSLQNMMFPPDLSDFKPKLGHEEYYLINGEGAVYSKKRFILMTYTENQYGHQLLRLTDGPDKPALYQHHAVWEYHNNETTTGYDIDHIDNNPRNNHISNLSKCTRKENIQKAAQQGRMCHGERHYKSKHTNQEIWEIKVLATHFNITNSQVGRFYNITANTVSNIKKGRTWKHISIEGVDPFELDLSTFTIMKSGKLNGTVLFLHQA